MFIFDAHCDSIGCPVTDQYSLNIARADRQFDFASSVGVTNFQVMGIFVDLADRTHIAYQHFVALQQRLMDQIADNDAVYLVSNGAQLAQVYEQPLNVLMAVEGGEILGTELQRVEDIYRAGVRALTLTWNNDNYLASGCQGGQGDRGLTDFGRKVIKRMNQLGMAIDIAHLAPKGMKEVLMLTDQPLIVSHGNCYQRYAHPRNVSDDMIKAIASSGGVIGVTYVAEFLRERYIEASIDDVVDHIAHIAHLVGTEYVGLGSDFDGIDHPLNGLSHVSQVPDLIEKLNAKGFHQQEIQQIMGENFLRVFKQIMQ